MKIYKGYEKHSFVAERYMQSFKEKFGRYPKYGGWVGMAANEDIIKYDGEYYIFDMNTKKYIRRAAD